MRPSPPMQAPSCKASGSHGIAAAPAASVPAPQTPRDDFAQAEAARKQTDHRKLRVQISGTQGCRNRPSDLKLPLDGTIVNFQCPWSSHDEIEMYVRDSNRLTIQLRTWFNGTADEGAKFRVSEEDLEIGKRTTHPVSCPACSKLLHIVTDGFIAENRKYDVPDDKKGNAFVATFWKADDLTRSQKVIAQALVLGYSLELHCGHSNTPRILLLEEGAIDTCGVELLHAFWEVQLVRHLPVHETQTAQAESRFQFVFSKLRALELYQYKKVVVLDLDLLVQRDISHMFCFGAPMAVFRGNGDWAAGQPRNPDSFFNRTGDLTGGINAGVMILEPNADDFTAIKAQIQAHYMGGARRGPEQDFLTQYYLSDWTMLPLEYNFQLHQLGYLHQYPIAEGEKHNRDMPYEHINILHFSGDYSPADFLFHSPRLNWEPFLAELLSKYKVQKPRHQAIVRQAAFHWYEAWREASQLAKERVPVRCRTWAGLPAMTPTIGGSTIPDMCEQCRADTGRGKGGGKGRRSRARGRRHAPQGRWGRSSAPRPAPSQKRHDGPIGAGPQELQLLEEVKRVEQQLEWEQQL